jgi:hypothetical protein
LGIVIPGFALDIKAVKVKTPKTNQINMQIRLDKV